MGASGRRIDLELDGLSKCQCQIRGSLPIMWHSETSESSCVRLTSQSQEASESEMAIFRGTCLAVDRGAVKFFERPEMDSIELKERLAHIREWTDKERSQSNRQEHWVALSIRHIGTDD